ncbi:hypothetical protein DTL42_17900 [Bremerella cremea]|uniref:Uncharacterized protein n=1 Tax=Bremerella cremea TaxID=1031537 RepID=A0A368KQM2_9BACT|nr:hypothetical protein [Bremerella cremea]RCS44185.1 hypothetical protein DTL42_17900 [Bremerella cremea]
MKFYTITSISNFIGNPKIKTFHADMFHGLAERDGKEYPHDTIVFANTDSPSPLLISRTVRHIPDICRPSSHLVVSQRYVKELEQLPHIRLMPVTFKRLVDVDYAKGDMSWDEKWGPVDPCELLRTLADVSEFHKRIGHYSEVQCYRWRDAVEKYPTAKEITIEERTPPLQQTSVIRLSSSMLEDFPIINFGASIVLSKCAFQILSKGIDRDFFIIREYPLV